MKILGNEYTLREVAEISIKGIFASAPFTGGLSSVYSDWQNKVQITNILDILHKFEERILKLESLMNSDFMNSTEYVALLMNVVLKGQNELIEQKRAVYAEYLTACCLKSNKSYDYISLLDIVSRINAIQINILKYTDNEMPTSYNWASGNLHRITSNSKTTVYQVERELDYLISLGLVSKTDIKGVGKLLATIGFEKDIPHFVGTEDVYYRTNMGNYLINFLNYDQTTKTI